jgi:hypothetical protein
MDPNETLKQIREIARENEEDSELAESFLELHRWFMSGGFLPSTWADKITARPSVIQSDDPWQSPATALKGEEPF